MAGEPASQPYGWLSRAAPKSRWPSRPPREPCSRSFGALPRRMSPLHPAWLFRLRRPPPRLAGPRVLFGDRRSWPLLSPFGTAALLLDCARGTPQPSTHGTPFSGRHSRKPSPSFPDRLRASTAALAAARTLLFSVSQRHTPQSLASFINAFASSTGISFRMRETSPVSPAYAR